MLLGNVIAISTAIFINNLNEKKQYPMYYKFVSDKTKGRIGDAIGGAVDRMLPHLKQKRLKKEQERIDSSLRETFHEFNLQKSFRQQNSTK